jgi:hypothetical protein
MHLSLQNNYAARAACDATQSLLRAVGHFQRCSASLSNAMALCTLTPRLLLVECPPAAHALALFPHRRQYSMAKQLILSKKLSPVYGPYSPPYGGESHLFAWHRRH